MISTKEVYGTDRYREYETRLVNPQECAQAPTIRIAYQDVTMQDMFTKPEYVRQLKELQEVMDIVKSQIHEIRRKGSIPTVVILDRKTEHLIQATTRDGSYVPMYMARSQMQESDRFMGLDIAINNSHRNNRYIRVCV